MRTSSSPLPRAIPALLAALLPAAAAPQGGATTFGGPGPLLRQADRDRDGRVDPGEWRAFLESLEVDRDGRLDPIALKARLLPLDVDGDGARTVADVEALFGKLDRDGDGALAPEEARPAGRAPAAEVMLAVLAIPAADADGDGAVSAEERERFLAGLRERDGGALDLGQVSAWVRGVVATSGRERALFSPAVLIAQIDAELDADGDGRLTKDDLQALFAQLDADGDGALSAEELAPRRGRAAAGEPQWLVRAEQRARPPLMPWQRDLEDALALSRATGKPLLICVNMDGEPASEFAAFTRYNDPDFVALASGFVPVVASPDTHQPLPRDDRGRRLADPRLGRLLCEEHVRIEPLLYERYFGGARYAPRHVGVAPDGTILFDIYLVQSFEGLERALRTHGKPPVPPPEGGTEMDLIASPDPRMLMALEDAHLRRLDDAALLASPDARVREELERRMVEGGIVQRVQLAEQAFSRERAVQHPELVRLALRDPDSSVRLQGLRAMIRFPERMDLERVPEAMALASLDPDLERELILALEDAAQSEDAARRARAGKLHAACTALATPSRWIDPKVWGPLLASAAPETGGADPQALWEALRELQEHSGAKPDDAELRVHVAVAWLRAAEAELAAGRGSPLTLQDVDAAAGEALALAPGDARALGVSARARYLLGDMEIASERAEQALPGLRREAGSPLSRSVLDAFVQARTRLLYQAMGEGAFPPEWASDVLAAQDALLADPAAPEARWVAHLQLLEALETRRPLARAIREALTRHPFSSDLHAWLRFQVLRDQGAEAMDGTCDGEALAALRAADPAARDWYHGLAMLFAAEHAVRARSPQAPRAYERCAELFERSAREAPGYAESAAHYRALALAGLARLDVEAGRLAEGLERLLEALAAGTAVARTADGLGASPLQLARELVARLKQTDAEAAARLQAAIEAVDVEEGG